jgi:hypothetical protein
LFNKSYFYYLKLPILLDINLSNRLQLFDIILGSIYDELQMCFFSIPPESSPHTTSGMRTIGWEPLL